MQTKELNGLSLDELLVKAHEHGVIFGHRRTRQGLEIDFGIVGHTVVFNEDFAREHLRQILRAWYRDNERIQA